MTLCRRLALLPALLCLFALPHVSHAAVAHPGAGANPVPSSKAFPVAPHSNVGIEWWYLNTHVTTSAGRHLAVIASFFRFGQGAGVGGNSATPQSHYLIYAVTDLDAKTHQTYSLADNKSLNLLKQLASLALLAAPGSSQAQAMAAMAGSGKFPPPTQLIGGACKVTDLPRFSCVYGNAASVTAVPGEPNTFRMVITGAAAPITPGASLKLDLTFAPQRIPMYVGGKGLTGVSTPDDMKYVSMTRCKVTGKIDTGNGVESVAASTSAGASRQAASLQNIGWFDHQWGSSWTPQNVGWDWWGVQLGSGVDVLFYELVQPGTRKVLQTMATFEYPDGHQVTTRNIRFTPDVTDLWTSAYNGASYPMKWRITFPDQHMWLNVDAAVDDQEMPILGQGKSAIWEGSVKVESGIIPALNSMIRMLATPGVGYMELVAYKAAKRP